MLSEKRWTREYWVIEYVNGQQFIGRFNSFWTRTSDLDAAALWDSRSEAENALSALLQEADDRIASTEKRPAQMWWDLRGGLVVVTCIERALRVKTPQPFNGEIKPLSEIGGSE